MGWKAELFSGDQYAHYHKIRVTLQVRERRHEREKAEVWRHE